MSNAPERIWAAHRQGKTTTILAGHSNARVEGWTEYVRADLFDALAQDASRAADLEADNLKLRLVIRAIYEITAASLPATVSSDVRDIQRLSQAVLNGGEA